MVLRHKIFGLREQQIFEEKRTEQLNVKGEFVLIVIP
jgi:hypothetical protein